MIQIQGKLPRDLCVAVSGGADSMAVVDFLNRNHTVSAIFCHHGTDTSEKAMKVVVDYCYSHGIKFQIHHIGNNEKPKEKSQEEYWRDFRYDVFSNVHRNKTVITAHHLGDCVETWIWSSLHGCGKIIPYRRNNVVRPFRLTKKQNFYRWCDRNNVPYIEDESNLDTRFTRNYIRHEMMPHVLRVNPGIEKVITKKVSAEMVE